MLQVPRQTRIRTSGPIDVEAIDLLFRDAFRAQAAPYEPAQVEAALADGLYRCPELFAAGHGLVAEHGGVLAGSVAWTLAPSGRTESVRNPRRRGWPTPVATLRCFCVAAEAAGRGIGRRLLAQATERARAAGAATIALNATLCALPFYARCGFRAVEERVAVLGRGIAFPYVVMIGGEPTERAR